MVGGDVVGGYPAYDHAEISRNSGRARALWHLLTLIAFLGNRLTSDSNPPPFHGY